jgi:hypothetical protein
VTNNTRAMKEAVDDPIMHTSHPGPLHLAETKALLQERMELAIIIPDETPQRKELHRKDSGREPKLRRIGSRSMESNRSVILRMLSRVSEGFEEPYRMLSQVEDGFEDSYIKEPVETPPR